MLIHPTARQLRWAFLSGAALFVILTAIVLTHALDGPDLRLNAWVARHVGPNLLFIPWTVWTEIGSGVVSSLAVAVAAFLSWRAGAAKTAVVIIAFAIVGGIAVDGFKGAIDRPYPPHERTLYHVGANETVECSPFRCDDFNITTIPADFSQFPTKAARAYPSGHTMGATLSWGLALLLGTRAVQRTTKLDRGAVAAWIAMAFLGGASRVPVQAHWFTDVVASWLLGGALLALALLADGRWNSRSAQRAIKDDGPAHEPQTDGVKPADPMGPT